MIICSPNVLTSKNDIFGKDITVSIQDTLVKDIFKKISFIFKKDNEDIASLEILVFTKNNEVKELNKYFEDISLDDSLTFSNLHINEIKTICKGDLYIQNIEVFEGFKNKGYGNKILEFISYFSIENFKTKHFFLSTDYMNDLYLNNYYRYSFNRIFNKSKFNIELNLNYKGTLYWSIK